MVLVSPNQRTYKINLKKIQDISEQKLKNEQRINKEIRDTRKKVSHSRGFIVKNSKLQNIV